MLDQDKMIIELSKYKEILEKKFHNMVEFDFTIENGKTYILNAHKGKRKDEVSIKIALDLFSEGIITAGEVFKGIKASALEDYLEQEIIKNVDNLSVIARGFSGSKGVAVGRLCFSYEEAMLAIDNKEAFIFAVDEIPLQKTSIFESFYCKGSVSARGGLTSHAAVYCRKVKKPMIGGIDDLSVLQKKISDASSVVTLDGNNGILYLGMADIIQKKDSSDELEKLNKLLLVVIKNNIISDDTVPLIWRFWDLIVRGNRYRIASKDKLPVFVNGRKYISFKQPSEGEISKIKSHLQTFENMNFMVEDLTRFLLNEFSSSVPVGAHYLYFRPLLDPLVSIEKHVYNADEYVSHEGKIEQLTGFEFFNVNKYIDFLIDIRNIRIYFSSNGFFDGNNIYYSWLNYLDYTNPNGESIVFNSFMATGIAVYINDVLIPKDRLMTVYHLIRRRQYYWKWYEENHVSKREIVDYLVAGKYKNNEYDRLFYLCEEVNLLRNGSITDVGESLIEENSMEADRNIEYILKEVAVRGYNDKTSDSNDYAMLMQRKEFKDLIALELYDCYFITERHEHDYQLLQEIVNTVSVYFSNPNTLKTIENGLLEGVPLAIVLGLLKMINNTMHEISKSKDKAAKDKPWADLKEKVEMVGDIFMNHDYITTDSIEQIFDINREKILPILKMVGCSYHEKGRKSVWIKAGVSKDRVNEILEENDIIS